MKNIGRLLLTVATLSVVACTEEKEEVFRIVDNGDGPVLGYSPASGVGILRQDGYSFKDLNRNGTLEPYEDWRLSADDRAADLASRMTIEEIAGLMLYSSHQAVPNKKGEYGGLPWSEADAEAWELSDRQKKFLEQDNLRHILVTSVSSTEDAARWNNGLQAYVEGLGYGIPCNNSSDPRNSVPTGGLATAEFNEGAGGDISIWPDGLAMAATFDPEMARQFGLVASKEYRALGLTTALSPQVDLGTEPRWSRISGTFGEHPGLSADMARAYIDGFQTSPPDKQIENGWGLESVNAMVKHWPGGGTGEAGRDAHYAYGKFGVYPGDNFDMHLLPFTGGAFALDGKTGSASAVMPYYTISYDQSSDSTNVGNAYSKYMITDLLRERYGFDGVVCTDWGVTQDEGVTLNIFAGKPWGVEDLTVAERHYMLLMAGVDQFGGNNDPAPLLEAYRMGVAEHGEEFMRRRFEESAVRLLRNIFRVGLFENPYVDPEASAATVGNPQFMEEGYRVQVRSVVMLKNRENILPVTGRKKVYIPQSYYPATKGWAGRGMTEERWEDPVSDELVERYFDRTADPAEADFAIVFVNSPNSAGNFGEGYDIDDRTAGGNGYVPISLQYKPYTADSARVHSIAAGDPVIDPIITNRSYWEKTVRTSNEKDLGTIMETNWKMDGKPVIVVVNITRPMVFNEFEHKADAILARFGIGPQAVLDIISGQAEPSGLLPLQMPADMVTVELQDEDRPFDMVCHTDCEGNMYDFGFGLNWSGVIRDHRTEKYSRPDPVEN